MDAPAAFTRHEEETSEATVFKGELHPIEKAFYTGCSSCGGFVGL